MMKRHERTAHGDPHRPSVVLSKWRWCRACDVLWFGKDERCWVCDAATVPGYLSPTMYARQPVRFVWSTEENEYAPGSPL